MNIASNQEVDLDSVSIGSGDFISLEIREVVPDDLLVISSRFNIDIIDLEDVFDPEEVPRADMDPQNQYLEIVLRLPIEWEISKERQFIPIISFLKQDYFISLHNHGSFISVTQRILKKSRGPHNQEPEKETRLHSPLRLFTGLILQTERTVKHFVMMRDRIEEKTFTSTRPQLLRDMFALAKSIVLLENLAKGNLNVIRKIIKSSFMPLDKDLILAGKFEDIETDFEQFYDQLRTMREVLNSSLDAYGSIIGNNLNDVMKTLTIFTVLLSNPILIASIYGMNIDVPFAHEPLAFLLVLIISGVMSSFMLFYMHRKGII